MKFRTQLFIVIGLLILILGIVWFGYPTRGQGPTQTFPATINRDCAPWDGGAFTVYIPYDPGSAINISIWQSPDIRFPSTFTFPDETGQTGFSYTLPELDPLQELTGQVTFWRVEPDVPVEGEFNLHTEAGQIFKGKFEAEWGDEVVMCG